MVPPMLESREISSRFNDNGGAPPRVPGICLRSLSRRNTAVEAEPIPYLLIHFLPAEQIQVVHGVADPLPACSKRQSEMGLFMPAQRAPQRHEPIAECKIHAIVSGVSTRS